jgi:hypothetical protein
MASTDELVPFVRDALARGVSRPLIRDTLLAAGWSSSQANEALAAFADGDFPIPVPRPRPYVDAREVFLYLAMFAAMYLSMVNFGGIVFSLIEHAFPRPNYPQISLAERVRFSVSVLIVAAPLFLYLFALLNREAHEDPGKRVSPIRRKLTYLTLFISGAVIIGVVVCTIYGFLGGDVTMRFLLKLLTVGAIAGAVFLFFRRDLGSGETGTSRSGTAQI